MTEKYTLPPEATEEALRQLIRQTIGLMGEEAPEALPHLIRQRLTGQVAENVDVDKIILDVMRERGREAQ